MKIEIKNRVSGAILFSIEAANWRIAVEAAVKSRANLYDANLSRANLSRANLSGAKNAALAIAQTRILPDGEIVGWKKLQGGTIAKLLIPADAKRSHAFGRKCRASYAICIDGSGVSQHDGKTKYEPGAVVECDKWDDAWQKESSGGIHFFITKEEAEAH